MRWRDVKQNKIVPKKEEEKNPKYDFNYASIIDRLKAFLTDSFMITMPIMYIVFYVVMGGREGFQAQMGMGWLYILIPHLLIISLLWTITGETPGCKAYDLEVIDNKTKSKPNIILSMLRYIFLQISILTVVGLLISFFREDKRTLHDLLSGTSIVKK